MGSRQRPLLQKHPVERIALFSPRMSLTVRRRSILPLHSLPLVESGLKLNQPPLELSDLNFKIHWLVKCLGWAG